MQLRRFDGTSEWAAPAQAVALDRSSPGRMAVMYRHGITWLAMVAVVALALVIAVGIQS
jgi:hypothetical protein